MQNKSFDFIGTPGGFFVTLILTSLLQIIPIAGAVLGMNMFYAWIADNSLVSGRKVVYKAEFMETLVFLFVNVLLVMVTLGIYFFGLLQKCISLLLIMFHLPTKQLPLLQHQCRPQPHSHL